MRRRTSIIGGVALLALVAAGVRFVIAQSADASAADSLVRGNDTDAAKLAVSDPEAFRQALETLKDRFDQSIHSARSVPEQRNVEYDATALEQGLRLARIYASASADKRPLRLFDARKSRIEGTVLLNERNYPAAMAKLGLALAEAEALGDVWLQIITLTNEAYAQIEMGQGAAALQSCERARALAGRHDARSRALTRFNLASVYMHLSNFDAAVSASKEAIELSHQIGNRLWEGNGLLNLGVAYRQLGRIQEARETLGKARDVLLTTKDKLGIGRTYYGLALVAGDAGDYRTGVTELELALPIIRSLDIRHSHEIEPHQGDYFNPIEESSIALLSTWYGTLNDTAKASEYSKALEALRAKHPSAEPHAHVPGRAQ